MLRVGINNNILLAGAAINEKGSLVISFRDKNAPVSEVNEDDFLNQAAGIKASNGETNIIVWPVSVENAGQTKEVKAIANDLAGTRAVLEHLLQGYVTSDRAALNPYEGVDSVTTTSLQSQSVVDRIYKNMTTQFVAKVNEIKDLIAVQEFRLLLVRRSKANHYGTFRKNFISDNPFWESMTVPKENSRVKFTAYEIKNEYNNPDPIARPEAGDQAPIAEGADAAAAILGVR